MELLTEQEALSKMEAGEEWIEECYDHCIAATTKASTLRNWNSIMRQLMLDKPEQAEACASTIAIHEAYLLDK